MESQHTSPTSPVQARSRSRTRRSVPNLDKLNIAPLSTNYPLQAEDVQDDALNVASPHSSYIQGKSAPTTPGILSLSRSNSRHRRHRRTKQTYAPDNYFASVTSPPSPTADEPTSIIKAKSSSALYQPAPAVKTNRRALDRTNDVARDVARHKKARSHQNVSADWLSRVGAAIASDAREQKGQNWLATRESSTSLAAASDDYAHALTHQSDTHDIATPRWPSKPGSRAASRAVSRHTSRRGSKVDIAAMNMSTGSRTPTADTHANFPGAAAFEPIFVDNDELDFTSDQETGDEEEVARLAREQGLGLGTWMDRLVGWTLFRVAEDGEATDTEHEEEERQEQIAEALNKEARRQRQLAEAARRRKEREAIAAASAKAGAEAANLQKEKDKENISVAPTVDGAQGEGGWQDAAWLLSVASKILL